jgi:protein-S-isoprenylcysteine O-methyltransferase Ste14
MSDAFTLPELGPLLPGIALWALALYLPLSVPLARLEKALGEGPLEEGWQQLVLVTGSLLLALAVGLVVELLLSWALGPGWAGSMGLIAVLGGLFLGLAAGRGDDRRR